MPINTLANVRALVGILLMRFCRNMLLLKEKWTAIRTLRGAARLDALPIAPR